MDTAGNKGWGKGVIAYGVGHIVHLEGIKLVSVLVGVEYVT